MKEKYIIIKSCVKHRVPWFSFSIHSYGSLLEEGPPDSIQCSVDVSACWSGDDELESVSENH